MCYRFCLIFSSINLLVLAVVYSLAEVVFAYVFAHVLLCRSLGDAKLLCRSQHHLSGEAGRQGSKEFLALRTEPDACRVVSLLVRQQGREDACSVLHQCVGNDQSALQVFVLADDAIWQGGGTFQAGDAQNHGNAIGTQSHSVDVGYEVSAQHVLVFFYQLVEEIVELAFLLFRQVELDAAFLLLQQQMNVIHPLADGFHLLIDGSG